jgi:hypothetical protein
MDIYSMVFRPFEAEARLNNISDFGPYRKETLHFTITKINWLTLFKEIIAVYSVNHTKHINTNWKSCWLLKQVGFKRLIAYK